MTKKEKVTEKYGDNFGASLFMQHFAHKYEQNRAVFINKSNILCQKNHIFHRY